MMTNEALLEKIGKLVQSEIQASEKRLTKKIDTLDMKIEIVNKRVETVEKEVQTMKKDLKQSIQDNADFFNFAGTFFDQIKNELLMRIKRIEKFVGLSTPQEN